jgi:hypothetical protein
LPRRNHFSGLANPIAAQQSFQKAGKFHRRAAIISACWQILSLRHCLFSGPVILIAAPPSFQRAGEPNRFRGPAHSIAKSRSMFSHQ